ncbi:MAG: hypothetical protein ABI134_07335 [Byssovorax sp.]
MSANATSGMRLLEERDEPAFVALLREVYGDTYAYRALYEPGATAELIRSGRAALWGDFAPSGQLLSHTGFLCKDPRGDYFESGMSFRSGRAREGTPDAVVWARLFTWLTPRCVLVHQNTSTWHPLAQRYAARYMRARPTGLIVDYVVGERLVGLVHPTTPMQALTMTSVVRPDRLPSPSRVRVVPRGPWGAWLASVLRALGIEAIVESEGAGSTSLGLEAIERNPELDLARRAVTRAPAKASLAADLEAPAARVDLLHLPCDDRMAAYPELERAGYVPVGVRPHATRADEVILQRLPGARRHEAMAALAAAELAPPGRALVEGWRLVCAQTT